VPWHAAIAAPPPRISGTRANSAWPKAADLLDDVKAMGTPLVIFTGGDPLQRDDLEELVRYAKSIGLRAGAIPAATPRLTRDRVISLKHAGLDQMAISLDGPNAKQAR
jgi:MoaA/NifB/PqqE/SkfB family radical SAM enzyme